MPSIYAILRKHTKGNRTMKRYTLAMKRKLVAEYATGDFPRKEFLSKHQIPNSTFHQWIHAYAEELLPALDAGMTISALHLVARSGIEPLTHGFSVRKISPILLAFIVF